MAYYTRLGGNNGNFQNMMEHGFGIVTVMNARIYDIAVAEKSESLDFTKQDAYAIANAYGTKEAESKASYRCTLDTLKIANVTMEGPSKTVMGGQYSNPLIKFGKSARLEMQDALGRAEAIEALCGGIQEWKGTSVDKDSLVGLHFGEDFVGPKMIVGDSFFIDRQTGSQVPVTIIFYQFLPDSIFNLTQDAEGDATVFDMNGDLLTTNVKVATGTDNTTTHGIFYSIVDKKEAAIANARLNIAEGGAVTLDPEKEADEHIFYEVSNKPGVWNDGDSLLPTLTDGQTVRVRVVEGGAEKAIYTGTYTAKK